MIAFVNSTRLSEYRERHPSIYTVAHATMPKDRKWFILNDGTHTDMDFNADVEEVLRSEEPYQGDAHAG